ncbi:hypothetical protein CAPTEDRAFT_206441 [Capitella teleta]|uniref:BTB domain-containing protein n=1 Tax=Capitella teleta TaxID=283909 RepID=R7T9B0_CAPTE|nr:hypothetical protein CAPTEDRAFT_206441 [Capitella teleta]|eukprot:ELT87995.1 hypothetical protein CAPTEDRAFT_206441 [Capitella teleta]
MQSTEDLNHETSKPATQGKEKKAGVLEVEYDPPGDIIIRHMNTDEILSSLTCKPESGATWRETSDKPHKIQNYLTNCWLQQNSCDVVLAMGDGEMQVHKAVFAAHSLGLAKDFLKFSPKKQLVIHLADYAPCHIFDLTEFLYTGALELTPKNAGWLYKCSDELGIVSLFQKSRDFLRSYNNMSAVTILNACDAAGLLDMRRDVMSYISNHFHETTPSADFVNVSLGTLIELLSMDGLILRSEMAVFCAVVRWVDQTRDQRMVHAHDLLKCVRFRLLDPELLARGVERITWIFEDSKCQALLGDAYKFHSLKACGSRLIDTFPPLIYRQKSPK